MVSVLPRPPGEISTLGWDFGLWFFLRREQFVETQRAPRI